MSRRFTDAGAKVASSAYIRSEGCLIQTAEDELALKVGTFRATQARSGDVQLAETSG